MQNDNPTAQQLIDSWRRANLRSMVALAEQVNPASGYCEHCSSVTESCYVCGRGIHVSV